MTPLDDHWPGITECAACSAVPEAELTDFDEEADTVDVEADTVEVHRRVLEFDYADLDEAVT